ncbi:methyltransferase family protein [Chloroflexota bacterium]
MVYIGIGIIGVLIIQVFNIVSLKRITLIKPLTWILGSSLLVCSIVALCIRSNTLLLPNWSLWLGWGLLLLSSILLLYALFINLPFRQSYINADSKDKLVKTGLYALVRHPWLHGLVIALLSLVLVSRSKLLLFAVPIWVSIYIVMLMVVDKFVFSKMFDGYGEYREKTPMLIPNRSSVNAFINLLKKSRV